MNRSYTWWPYQFTRSAGTNQGLSVASSVRLAHTQSLLMLQVVVTGAVAGSSHVMTVSLPTIITSYAGQVWQWGRPAPAPNASRYTVASKSLAPGSSSGLLFTGIDTGSNAITATAFACNTTTSVVTYMVSTSTGEVGAVNVTATADGSGVITLNLILAIGSDAMIVNTLATVASAQADVVWDTLKSEWEQLWSAAFTPSNGLFSGNLPVVSTARDGLCYSHMPSHAVVDRSRATEECDVLLPLPGDGAGDVSSAAYYAGVISLLQAVRAIPFGSVNGGFPPAGSLWPITCGPVWATTDVYLWDTSMIASAMTLLEPVGFRALMAAELTIDVHQHYAIDTLSSAGVGPWYSFNDISMFTMLDTYGRLTGDAFYNSSMNGMTVLQWMDDVATFWQTLRTNGSGLADYGLAYNLLECVPTYIHKVPSLNAANVFMMNRTAALWAAAGNLTRAAYLQQQAAALLPLVMSLYYNSSGYWACEYLDGSLTPVMHVIDFVTIADSLAPVLNASVRSEMLQFVHDQLLTPTWMRALSLNDPAANASDRNDHGPFGAYDGWIPRTALAMVELGDTAAAMALMNASMVNFAEGAYGQAHHVYTNPLQPQLFATKAGPAGGQDYIESVAGAFAEFVLKLMMQR